MWNLEHVICLILVAGCVGTIEESEPNGEFELERPNHLAGDPAADPDVAYAPAALLTAEQYNWAVFDLLGVTPTQHLPSANQSDLFENNAFQHVATERSTNIHAGIATEVAEGISSEQLVERLGCDDNCNGVTLSAFFRRAFRRNLPAIELEKFTALLENQPNQEAGLRMLLEVVLLSPQFIYRFEAGVDVEDGLGDVDDFSLASRLSFFLWNSSPDDVLLDLAEAKQLNEADTLANQVDRMMSDARFERSVLSFHEQWLDLEEIVDMQKSGRFEQFTDLGEDWKQSIDATIVRSFEEGLPNLLRTNEYALTEALAEAYGFEPEGALGVYTFDETERAGLLTHPAMMAKLSYSDQDAPIHRGVFVLKRFLCSEPPAPPDDIDLTPPPVAEDSTTRERFETLTSEEPCYTCHQAFNPIGFLFSKYDAVGRFAEQDEAGRLLDSAATPNNIGDLNGNYPDAVALSQALSNSSVVRDCVAGHWMRYAIGRPIDDQDARSLYEANTAFQESEGDFRALMKAIAIGPAFQLFRAEETP